MKKLILLAATAALILTSCAKIESTQQFVEKNEPVTFGVYSGRTAETKATYGDITTANLQASEDGFGVFAYYTLAADWTSSDKPNFMYNQQVRHISSYTSNPSDYTSAKYPSSWYYSPLKYWPNGQNSTAYTAAATSADKVSFFAYAPQIEESALDPAPTEGITAMSANSAAGAPTVSFTVPAKAEEQIDLLYAIPAKNITKQVLDGRVAFTFKHALAKLNFKVQAVADAVSPTTSNLTDDLDLTIEDGETWIVLDSLVVSVNGTKTGTLSLDTLTGGTPNWTSVTGNTKVKYVQASYNQDSVVTADSKTGFKVTEVAHNLNTTISPMVIPGTITASNFTVTAAYWVITQDPKLDGGFSTVQNIITTSNSSSIALTAGLKYDIVVRLGLNSIDFNVTNVAEWGSGGTQNFDLPLNQQN